MADYNYILTDTTSHATSSNKNSIITMTISLPLGMANFGLHVSDNRYSVQCYGGMVMVATRKHDYTVKT